jgi:Domain of unknown function (DUF4439)
MRAFAQASDPPASSGGASAREISALQATLAAEHAAIYGYGIAGAHLTGTALARATTDWTGHQVAADKLAALLRSSGVSPTTAAVAYRVPRVVSTPAQAVVLAAALEDQVASAYLALVAASGPSLRVLAAHEVRDAALRAASWRGHTVPFPGLTASDLRR